tara:strand:- start:366 stop:2426 length:2061 start_codon:yes stop_codon:yes gene_type:complete
MKLGPKEIKVVNEYFVRPVKNRLKEIFLKKGLPQLKTSDEIERPQRALDKEAIDAFMKRNPKAEGGRIPFGDGSITKIKKLQGEFKKDPKLVKLFNEGKLYHYRTTIGAEGGPKDKKAYRGTKEELEKIMKQGKSTGKPVVLTAKMKSNIKEYEDRTGKKYEDLNRNKQMQVRKGKQEKVGTLPTKEEMKDRISVKQKGKSGPIEDVIFPNPKMKEKFLNELELKYTYVPGKSMPEKFKSANFAKRYPISERQFERMVSFYVKEKGLKYPKGGEAAQVIAKRRELQKKVTGIKTESTIVGKIKKPILKEKNLSNKIDLAHRVSMEHMARLGLEYDTRLLGFDSRLINQAIVKPAEFRLSKLYDQQFDVMKKIEKSGLTKELKDQLVDINDQVKKNVKKTSGRLFGITVDPKTLEPSFEGINKKFSITSENLNVKELDKLPRQERIKLLSPYVSKKVNAEIKRGFRPADFKEILKDESSRKQVLNYVKKFAPDILGKVKKAVANPASKESFGLYANPMFSPGILKEAFKQLPTPAGAVALNLGLGVDPTSAIDRAGIAAEAAFAPALVKQAAKLGSVGQRIANLGLTPAMAARAARIASPLGIASLAAEGLYQGGKFTKKRMEELRSMTPEQREELRRQGEAQAFDPFQAAGGGIAKLAGDRSGAMLTSMNPDKDGLPGLSKRGKKQ